MPTIIHTSRLDLVPLDPAAIKHLLEGRRAGAEALIGKTLPAEFPSTDELGGFLPIQLHRMLADPAKRGWTARLIMSTATGEVIGHAGFHGPPDVIGRAEIGYTVFTPFRGRGYAKETAAALARWAFEQGEREVYATISPDNAPSLAIVRGLGFTQTGTQMDEVDGLELVFVLRADEQS